MPSFHPLAALASSSALYQCLKRPGCKTGRHHVILAPTATTAIINIVILILIIIFIISIIIFIFIIFIITITSLFVFSKGLGSTVARRANLQAGVAVAVVAVLVGLCVAPLLACPARTSRWNQNFGKQHFQVALRVFEGSSSNESKGDAVASQTPRLAWDTWGP